MHMLISSHDFNKYADSPLLLTQVSQACLALVHNAEFSLLYTGEAYGDIPHGKGKQYF